MKDDLADWRGRAEIETGRIGLAESKVPNIFY